MRRQLFENGIVFEGDSLSILRDLPDASVDAVVTDPPYSSGGLHVAARQADPAKKYQTTGTKKAYAPMLGDAKDQRSWMMWASLWLSECLRIARPGAACLVFTDWRQLPAMTDAIQTSGWIWRGIVVWHKPTARPMLGEFRRDAEFIVYARKDKARLTSGSCLPGMFSRAVNSASKVHLTSKPVQLLVDLLEVTPAGCTVLDPFLGGGTTALACLTTGRRFVGIELSHEYAQISCTRIKDAETAGQPGMPDPK